MAINEQEYQSSSQNGKHGLSFISKNVINSILNDFSITFYLLEQDETFGYRFNYVGQSVKRLLGYEPQSFITDPEFWQSHLHEEDRAKLLKDGRRQLKQTYQKFTYRIKNKDGEYRWLRDELRPIFQDNTLHYYIGLWIDISDEKSFEQSAIQNTKRFQTLIAASGQIIWTTNPEGKVVEDLPGWRAFTGQSSDEIKGDGWLLAIHPEDRAKTLRLWQKAITENSIYRTEYRIKKHDGTYHWFMVRGIPFKNEHNQTEGWIGACTDITDQVEREELLENYAARLEQSNRDLQEFAYIASHDLQEPSRKILAFGDRLLSLYHDQLDERGRDYLQRMMNASQRMQNLINSLLTLSRVETRAKPFEQVNLKKILEDVVGDLEFKIQRVEGRVYLMDLPIIEADEAQMYQLFENLIKNALKFHRPKVKPMVKVYCEQEKSDDKVVTIVVEDNGIGIDQQFSDRIFKPFQRLHTREEYEGSGMGLAICRRIVERHNGDIYFTSELGKGTKFFVELPVEHK